jgi:hypothetical protein
MAYYLEKDKLNPNKYLKVIKSAVHRFNFIAQLPQSFQWHNFQICVLLQFGTSKQERSKLGVHLFGQLVEK